MAAAIAIGVLVLGWQFRVPLSKGVVGGPPAASAPSPIVRLHAADPAALKQQLVDELRAAGVEAIGYDRLGLSGVDAETAHAGARCRPGHAGEVRHRRCRADGVVRIEITQSR